MGTNERAGRDRVRRLLGWAVPLLLVGGLVAGATAEPGEPEASSVRATARPSAPEPSPHDPPDLDIAAPAPSDPPTSATPTTRGRPVRSGDRPRRPVPTIRPPAVHPPDPSVPETPPTTIPEPPVTTPVPTTVVDRCASLPRGAPFVPERPGLYAVDSRTSTAISLAPGFSIGGASWSPIGDRVVFSGRESGGTHGSEPTTMWIARADGSAIERVAADAAYPNQPSWSPDGKHIAYYSSPWDGHGRQGLYLYDVARRDSRELARVDGGGFAMEWSRDSRRIAIPAPNEDEVTVVDAADGSVRSFEVTSAAYSVAWSPLGDRLLVSDLEGPTRLVRLVDGTAETIVADGRYARWSPSDDRISVWRSFGAHVVDLRTGQDRLVAANADPIGWSHRGELLSLAVGTRLVDVIDVDSGCRRSVASSSDLDVGPAAWSPAVDAVLLVAEATGARRY